MLPPIRKGTLLQNRSIPFPVPSNEVRVYSITYWPRPWPQALPPSWLLQKINSVLDESRTNPKSTFLLFGGKIAKQIIQSIKSIIQLWRWHQLAIAGIENEPFSSQNYSMYILLKIFCLNSYPICMDFVLGPLKFSTPNYYICNL